MAEKIIAAGGIVENEEGKILFIYRRGKWDLPKGKLDEGESIEQCAVREVEEETGLRDIRLNDFIDTTSHYYRENGKNMLKQTYWYAMTVTGTQKLTPQLEEDILEGRWVSQAELDYYFANTFNNIKEIVRKYYERKPGTARQGD